MTLTYRHLPLLVAALAAFAVLGVGCASEPPAAAPGEMPSAEPPAPPDAPEAPLAPPDVPENPEAARKAALEKAVAYLVKAQRSDGSWGPDEPNLGITALVTQALVASGMTPKDEPVRKGIDFVLAQQADDGHIAATGHENYVTSIALMILSQAPGDTYADQAAKAKAWLVEHQWDEGEAIAESSDWYGGAGYGSHERPDLSNAGYLYEAMKQANLPPDHPLWKKAAIFVSRSQAKSEFNDGAAKTDESGGMIYTPVGEGESKAGTIDLPGGGKGLKAYGSMTYVGFKSYVYAGLKRDDPRVQAALDWIRRHWTFEENPELGQQGLYYYYMVAGRALKAWGEDTIRDASRRDHPWRAELTGALVRRQKDDGSWSNEADRWFEGYPPVPTSYAVIALVSMQK